MNDESNVEYASTNDDRNGMTMITIWGGFLLLMVFILGNSSR